MAENTDDLGHYGKKGMHWGIRNEDPTSGKTSSGKNDGAGNGLSAASLDEYKSLTKAQPQLSGLAASKKAQENIAKSHDKLDDPGPRLPCTPKDIKREAKAADFNAKADAHDKVVQELTAERDALAPGFKSAYRRRVLNEDITIQTEARDRFRDDAARTQDGRLTSGQKKALVYAGVGALVVGSVVYSSHKQKMQVANWEKAAAAGDIDAKLSLYQHHVGKANVKTWMFGSFVQDPTSWDREEFELPAGHTFHRISTRDESEHGFSLGTYSTPNEADFNRYVAGFRKEKGPLAEFHHVTFTAKGPTKVPNLHTTVETLRETMQAEQHGLAVTRAQALAKYESMSGGSWNDHTAASFFSNLKAKGYGALVDEMDAGVIGDKPLVFFGDANPKQARPLSKEEISVREKSIELMTQPPRKA